MLLIYFDPDSQNIYIESESFQFMQNRSKKIQHSKGPIPCCGSSINVVEQFQSTPRRLGSMEILGVFFIYLAKGLEIFNVIEFNCSSLGLVQLKLQFLL